MSQLIPLHLDEMMLSRLKEFKEKRIEYLEDRLQDNSLDDNSFWSEEIKAAKKMTTEEMVIECILIATHKY